MQYSLPELHLSPARDFNMRRMLASACVVQSFWRRTSSTAVQSWWCRKTAQVRLLQGKAAGAVSGGTIASLMGALFEETPEEIKFAADPYCLNPPEAHR